MRQYHLVVALSEYCGRLESDGEIECSDRDFNGKFRTVRDGVFFTYLFIYLFITAPPRSLEYSSQLLDQRNRGLDLITS